MSIFHPHVPHMPHQSHRLQALEGALGAVAIGAIVIAGYAWMARSGETTSSTVTTSSVATGYFTRPAQAAPLTIFLAATSTEAEYLTRMNEESNLVRASFGSAPLNSTVVVTPTTDDASRFEAIISEGNGILNGMNISNVVVVRTGSLVSESAVALTTRDAQLAYAIAQHEAWAYEAFGPASSGVTTRDAQLAYAIAQHEGWAYEAFGPAS